MGSLMSTFLQLVVDKMGSLALLAFCDLLVGFSNFFGLFFSTVVSVIILENM